MNTRDTLYFISTCVARMEKEIEWILYTEGFEYTDRDEYAKGVDNNFVECVKNNVIDIKNLVNYLVIKIEEGLDAPYNKEDEKMARIKATMDEKGIGLKEATQQVLLEYEKQSIEEMERPECH